MYVESTNIDEFITHAHFMLDNEGVTIPQHLETMEKQPLMKLADFRNGKEHETCFPTHHEAPPTILDSLPSLCMGEDFVHIVGCGGNYTVHGRVC